MDPDIEHRLYALLAVAAVVYMFQQKIRFLLQGRWYRSLQEKEQAALDEQTDGLWHEYHGRRIPLSQLSAGIIVTVLIFVLLAYLHLGLR